MKIFYRSYLIPSLFIFLWWCVAFYPQKENNSPNTLPPPPLPEEFPSPLSYLSPMKRQMIHQALAGDVSLMTKLITEWDLDAKILDSQGFNHIRRLPKEIFLRALTLGRHLKKYPNELTNTDFLVTDDRGKTFFPKKNGLVPQTYIAATFLLSLTDKKNLIALPNGFKQHSLFSNEDLSSIDMVIDRYHIEKLALKCPKLCFVSPFSHPSVVQSMQNLGTEIFTLDSFDTIEKVPEAIKLVGDAISCPLKAELLNTFVASTFLAIDNRIKAMPKEDEKVMLVNYYSRFSLPTKRSLSHQLLKRLHFQLYEKECNTLYTVPVSQEEIATFAPDTLLISTPGGHFLDLSSYPKMLTLPKVAYLNDTIQQSPTQWIALAYYDLCKALWNDSFQ